MKAGQFKNLVFIIFLITATVGAMAYSSDTARAFFTNFISHSSSSTHYKTNSGVVNVAGQLVQDKVLQGSDGLFGLSLTLKTDDISTSGSGVARNVDMVIVLDRSGSMRGRKIMYAREAILGLISSLSPEDRFALVAYSDGVQILSELLHLNETNRKRMLSAVRRVRTGGGTNLGEGLQTGINILKASSHGENIGKVILVSDGLANKGIKDIPSLGKIAAVAAKKEFAVSSVGVGSDFNEHLMTAIADQGTGNYYYLENPSAFAEVFQKEFYHTRTAALTALAVQIPISSEITLTDAAGYPIKTRNDYAVFYPGSLRSGQTRKLFLTLQVPTDTKKTFEIGKIKVRYLYNNQTYETTLDKSFNIACVNNKKRVFTSINKTNWSEQVINEDFNRLKQEVASDIKGGEKEQALNRIEEYYGKHEEVNSVMRSEEIAENLDKDLNDLRTLVQDTFKGDSAAVLQKQKNNAKALQYEGYSGRRK